MRILGQDPVVESTIFDMVSTGGTFRVSIPPKKRFVVGSNDAPATSQNKLENLRPTAFLTSLLIDPPDPAREVAVLVHDAPQNIYVLLVLHKNQDELALARSIYFDQYTLQITRQKTFDASGEVVSDTSYGDWTDHEGIPYPSSIEIQRPRDNYEVQIAVSSIRFNTPDVTDAKFVLVQPAGTQLEELK
jgi:outer membrane lipoprotein-sorting protein